MKNWLICLLLLFCTLHGVPSEQLIIKQDPPYFNISLRKNPFKENDHITLYQSTLGNKVAALFTLTVSKTGIPYTDISDGRSYALFDISLSDEYFLPAEPVEYILISDDQLKAAYCRFIPKPVETSIPCGAKIWLELTSPDNLSFQIHGTGFLPNENLTLTSYSGTEKVTDYLTANPSGKFICLLKPALPNATTGIAKAVITTSNLTTLTLTYTWGK